MIKIDLFNNGPHKNSDNLNQFPHLRDRTNCRILFCACKIYAEIEFSRPRSHKFSLFTF